MSHNDSNNNIDIRNDFIRLDFRNKLRTGFEFDNQFW